VSGRKWEGREGKAWHAVPEPTNHRSVLESIVGFSETSEIDSMKLRKIEHASSVNALGNANHSMQKLHISELLEAKTRGPSSG